MRFARSRWLSSFLILAFLLTSSTPSYALRQVEPQESDSFVKRLARRLQDSARAAVAQVVAPGAPQLLGVPAGGATGPAGSGVPQGARIAGLEEIELAEGTLATDGTDVEVKTKFRIGHRDRTQLVTLPNGSTIEAKAGGVVIIEDGATVESGVKVVARPGKKVTILGNGTILQTGTLVDGQVWIGRNVRLNAKVFGEKDGSWIDHDSVFTPGSQTVVEDSVIAKRDRFTRDQDEVTLVSKNVMVKQATGITNSVIWGSMLFQDAVALDSIMDFALAGNHTLQSRSRIAGVSPASRTSAAHFNYLISMFNLPLTQQRDLTDPSERQEALTDLLALRYGELENTEILTEAADPAHNSRPLERLTLRYDGASRVVLVRSSNLGAAFGTSNFRSREFGGTKGQTLLWGGVMAGVNSDVSAPAVVAPNSVLANSAEASGQVAAPGTLIVPVAGSVGGAEKPGRMDLKEGYLGDGVEINVGVRIQAMHATEILIQAAAAGVDRARSPAQRAAYTKEVLLLQKAHAEAVADLKIYLAAVKKSAINYQTLLESGEDEVARRRLDEHKRVLGVGGLEEVTTGTDELAAYVDRLQASTQIVSAAVDTGTAPPTYFMSDIVTFADPGTIKLMRGEPAMDSTVVAAGQEIVQNRQALGVIFAAGRGGRYADPVREKSPQFQTRSEEFGRVDANGNAIKFAAPLGVSNFGAVMRQLESMAELGYQSGQPFEVAIVDSSDNRQMLISMIEEDRTRQKPRIRWEYLNFVGTRVNAAGETEGFLVNGGSMLELNAETGEPIPGVRHAHVPLVDQGQGLPATYAADGEIGGVAHSKGDTVMQWNPATGQRDLPYTVPSGEYGALMAGVQAAQSAGIDVTQRHVMPTYGDQAGLYSDATFLAALLGNMPNADVTGVSVPHALITENDAETGRAAWNPNGGIIAMATWPDGTQAMVIAERDVRDPARTEERIYNSRLDEQELALVQATGAGFPFNTAPPVFSANFMGDLLNAQVDIRRQAKTRELQWGATTTDTATVDVTVTELEATQLLQIATQDGRSGQTAQAPAQVRQGAVKHPDNVHTADNYFYTTGREELQGRLGIKLSGDVKFVEVSESHQGFLISGEGSLTIRGNVGVEVDRHGVWVRKSEGVSRYRGGPDLNNFSRERRLLLPARESGVIPLDSAVTIDNKTFDQLPPDEPLNRFVTVEEAQEVLAHLGEFQVEGEFNLSNSSVSLISHGRINRVFLVERNDGVSQIVFRLNGIWRTDPLDRNHDRFEQKQNAAMADGEMPEGWSSLAFLNRTGSTSKLYQDSDGDQAFWRVMDFSRGRVVQSASEIPADKRAAAVERFGRVLVQFRKMLERPEGGDFEDSLPEFQSVEHHLAAYTGAVVDGVPTQVNLDVDDKLPKMEVDPSRLEGRDEHGDFAARNEAFQAKVAAYRAIIEPALVGMPSVVTHGDPKINNVFWVVDADGEWIPIAMGDLDTVQMGHETLDIADAVRLVDFVGGEDADPANLELLTDAIDQTIRGWLAQIEESYSPDDRARLEPLVYLSVAAIHFVLGIRFYTSYVTGDSYFDRPTRYGQPVADPGKYLRLAEVQMAQAEAFAQAYKDKPGMAELAKLVTAGGLEENNTNRRRFVQGLFVAGVGAAATGALWWTDTWPFGGDGEQGAGEPEVPLAQPAAQFGVVGNQIERENTRQFSMRFELTQEQVDLVDAGNLIAVPVILVDGDTWYPQPRLDAEITVRRDGYARVYTHRNSAFFGRNSWGAPIVNRAVILVRRDQIAAFRTAFAQGQQLNEQRTFANGIVEATALAEQIVLVGEDDTTQVVDAIPNPEPQPITTNTGAGEITVMIHPGRLELTLPAAFAGHRVRGYLQSPATEGQADGTWNGPRVPMVWQRDNLVLTGQELQVGEDGTITLAAPRGLDRNAGWDWRAAQNRLIAVAADPATAQLLDETVDVAPTQLPNRLPQIRLFLRVNDDWSVTVLHDSERGGLEEAPSPLAMELPDPIRDFDVIGRIQADMQSSLFLRTVREQLNQDITAVPTGFTRMSDLFDTATDLEEALRLANVTADNWENVIVPSDFGILDARRMQAVHMTGHVRLGLLRETTVVRRVLNDDTELDEIGSMTSRIVRTDLHNVIVGNDVFIQDNTYLSGYVIGDGAAVYDNSMVTVDDSATKTFGVGFEIPVGPEVGGREVMAYPEIPFEAVARLAIDRDGDFQSAYQAELDQYIQAAQSQWGYIGAGAIVASNTRVNNSFVQDGALLIGVATTNNSTLLSGSADLIAAGTHVDSGELQASERTRVVNAQQIDGVIFQPGSSAESGAIVTAVEGGHGVLMMEHSHALEHAKVKDSILAPNTGVGEGEVTSSLMGPFIGMHHQSIAIALVWHLGLGNVAALSAIGSNHTSRAPDQEFWPGEGTFFGLQVAMKFPGNFSRAPQTIIGTVDSLPQVVTMPYSLIEKPRVDIPGLSNALGQISPGWVGTENPFTPLRNEGKYAGRDKAKRHNLGGGELRRKPFELLRPSTINMMIEARDGLAAVDPNEDARVASIPASIEGQVSSTTLKYYTDAEVPGVGKNFLTEADRTAGIENYNFMIHLYALKGLLAELERLEAADNLSSDSINELLTTESQDLRWEHERRVLLTEVFSEATQINTPQVTELVSEALGDLANNQDKLAELVADSKKKDDIRGAKVLGSAYADAHPPAEEHKFVKQMNEEAGTIRRQTNAVVAKLAGLEELALVEVALASDQFAATGSFTRSNANGSTSYLFPVAEPQAATPFKMYWQAGLEEPDRLPPHIRAVAYPLLLAAALTALNENPAAAGDLFVLNANEVADPGLFLPTQHPVPASVAITREVSVGLVSDLESLPATLTFLKNVAQRNGATLMITSLTFVTVGNQVYAIVTAA